MGISLYDVRNISFSCKSSRYHAGVLCCLPCNTLGGPVYIFFLSSLLQPDVYTCPLFLCVCVFVTQYILTPKHPIGNRVRPITRAAKEAWNRRTAHIPLLPSWVSLSAPAQIAMQPKSVYSIEIVKFYRHLVWPVSSI